MDYLSKQRKKTRNSSVEEINSSSSSSSIIASNFDILALILKRLPLKSLLVFKSVSKQWLSLICHPHFVHQHFLHNPSLSTRGLFWKRSNLSWILEYNYIFLDGDINSYVPFKTIAFAKETPAARGIVIVQSCNGLLLCRSSEYYNYTYYVFNPFTKQHKILPRSQLSKCGFTYLYNFSLAFDPYKSPYYKVVSIWGNNSRAVKYRIEVYSSETTLWRLCEDEFTPDMYPIPCVSAIFWNGSLNWNADYGSLIYFDIDRELFGVVPRTLQVLSRRSIDSTDVTEYQGCLYLIERGNDGRFLNIFEMDTAYTGWKVKCNARDLEQLNSSQEFGPFGYVVFILKGEGESSKMVLLSQENKVLSYAVNEMRFENIYDISPQHFLGKHCSFYQYIESLACV